MAKYICGVCAYIYDEDKEDKKFSELPDDWICPICSSPKSDFSLMQEPKAKQVEIKSKTEKIEESEDYLEKYSKEGKDEQEPYLKEIHQMAVTGKSIIEPMRTSQKVINYWDDVLVKGAQLKKIPLDDSEPVKTETLIGPSAKVPLKISMPIYVSHMSFGALSKEAKTALAKGSAEVKTAMCSGEGGILPESIESAYRYIFEYVPNRYSVSDENLKKVDAVEIKFGQSAKPGMGGHLPGAKVTKEIAEIRNKKMGEDIISPASFPDIRNEEELKDKVNYLREKTGGKPIGIKLAAGDIEGDLEIALKAQPDFITIDGRPGGTGASPLMIKRSTSMPTLFALARARKFLDKKGAKNVSLVITGGLRNSADFVKALALGADAVAVATAAMIAIGCQQYRICNTDKCPVGIATHDENLRSRFDVEKSSKRIANYFHVCNEELKEFARLTGNNDISAISVHDLMTTNREISDFTDIKHV